MENWKVISKNPKYEISDCGRVRKTSTKRVKVPEINKKGYYSIRLSYGKAATGTRYNIHKLVAEAFLPNPNNFPVINHIDGNKLNNSVDNLEWCSYSHNNKHAYEHGLKKPYQQRISNDDRREIGNLRRNGMRVKDIAEKYNVTVSAIYKLFYEGKIPNENK